MLLEQHQVCNIEQQDIIVSADDGKCPKHVKLSAFPPPLTVLVLHVGLPRIDVFIVHVSNTASVVLSSLWFEGDALGEVKLPALFEGQVRLLGIWENLAILQQFNGDIRRVEATDMADQGVLLSVLSGKMAVHLNLGTGCFPLYSDVQHTEQGKSDDCSHFW